LYLLFQNELLVWFARLVDFVSNVINVFSHSYTYLLSKVLFTSHLHDNLQISVFDDDSDFGVKMNEVIKLRKESNKEEMKYSKQVSQMPNILY
jgi:hypothetical protein